MPSDAVARNERRVEGIVRTCSVTIQYLSAEAGQVAEETIR
jgi:hypothetical protein